MTDNFKNNPEQVVIDDVDASQALLEKLADTSLPGFEVECDPEEAELAGAFVEDSMSEQDALDSVIDQDDDQGEEHG